MSSERQLSTVLIDEPLAVEMVAGVLQELQRLAQIFTLLLRVAADRWW